MTETEQTLCETETEQTLCEAQTGQPPCMPRKKLSLEQRKKLLEDTKKRPAFVDNEFWNIRYQYNDHEAFFRTRYQFMIII